MHLFYSNVLLSVELVNAWKFFNEGGFIGVSFVRFWLSL